MNLHKVGLYLCRCCGSTVEQDSYGLAPFCCGVEMRKEGERRLARDELSVPSSGSRRWAKTIGRRLSTVEMATNVEYRT
jgi:hypothetical protein